MTAAQLTKHLVEEVPACGLNLQTRMVSHILAFVQLESEGRGRKGRGKGRGAVTDMTVR